MMINVPPAYHGAFDFAELERLGLHPDDVLDFSVNSNPYGPSPQVVAALESVPLDRYPDRESLALRRALSDRLGIPVDAMVVGNGTAELLWLAAFATLRAGDTVLILGPTFGEYERVAALMQARVVWWRAESPDFAIDPAAIAAHLRQVKPRVMFLCNPNNPTGQIIPAAVIAAWADSNPDTLLMVDEAYLSFAPACESAVGLRRDNILVIRSMTKDYALAGLRLGYAVGADATLIESIGRVRPAWNVNGLAQAAGVAALGDESYYARCLADLRQAKVAFVAALESVGYRLSASAVHYFLVDVGDAAAFRGDLLKHGLMVRDCASFRLPQFVRIATRRPDQNQRLLAALQQR